MPAPNRLLLLTALVAVIAPVVAVATLLFVPACAGRCLGEPADAPLGPGPRVAFVTLLLTTLAWLVAELLLVIVMWRRHRRDVPRLVATVAGAGFAFGCLGFALGSQSRLRQGAEDAVLFALIAALAVLSVGLPWAVVTAGRPLRSLPLIGRAVDIASRLTDDDRAVVALLITCLIACLAVAMIASRPAGELLDTYSHTV